MTAAAPEGHSTVSPFLVVEDVEKEVAFVKTVFQAEIGEQHRNPEGQVWHAEARIGNSVVMIDRTSKHYQAYGGMLYVWVQDVDAAYKAALAQDAESVSEPKNHFWGTREAGVKDTQGNTWWIARQAEKLSNQEVERRLAEQRRKRL